MNYYKYTCFAAGRQGRILTLTMNRPDYLSAVNKDMHDELRSIFYDPQLYDGADVIVPYRGWTGLFRRWRYGLSEAHRRWL